MSIKINDTKLIIEIECDNQKPLSLLADYQLGLINLLHVADVTNGGKNIDTAIHFATDLLKEMIVSPDQQDVTNKLLDKNKMDAEFNNWA